MKTYSLRLTLLALLAVIGLFLAACGDDDSESADVGDLGPDPATMAPADAPFYGEVVVRPDGEMLENFNATISKLTGLEDPYGMLEAEVEAGLESEGDGFTYAEDIEPWLGPRIGGFATDFDPVAESGEGAVIVAVTDTEAAQAFIDEASETSDTEMTEETYEGVDYTTDGEASVGISGDFLIAGTQQGFEDAVDAGAGDSLAENSDVSASRDEVPEDALFDLYVDTQAVIDLVETSGVLPRQQLDQFREQVAQYAEGPIDFWGTVGEDEIELAFSSPAMTDAPEPTELVESFPADAWLAFATAGVGEQLDTVIQQFETGFQAGFEQAIPPGVTAPPTIDPLQEVEDATGLDLRTDLDWIGDVGGYAQGTSLFGLGGALVIEATDEAAASETVDTLRQALEGEGAPITPTDDGFEIQVPPATAEVVVRDGNFVAAAGAATVDEALDPGDTLDGSDRFGSARDALGDDVVPGFYLDFVPVVQLIDSFPEAANDPDYQEAKPYLDALDFLVAGSAIDGDRATGSLVLGVREPSEESDSSAAAITP